MYSKGLTLARNRFVANRSHRAYGLLLQSVDDSLISANEIAGNTLGLFLENGHANRVLGNRIAGNHVGIRVSDSSDANVFAGNRFTGNIHPVETTGDNRSNQWAADGRGNQWEGGASTLDLDRNGIADLPHRELDLFGGLRRELPAIGLLAGSPAERLLRFVHARLAIPGAAGHRRSGAARRSPARPPQEHPDDRHHRSRQGLWPEARRCRTSRCRSTPGEVALLVGANGCGKSTTLRLLAGLTTPDAGRIVLAGHDAGVDPAAARAGAVVPAAVRRASTSG